ncbi:MAG: Cna B-type domain-containing protein [Lachnospiraceae bacterium]|nr:Cna B-type domain-containing protein [Lachnospiraceae bacterium]
MKRNGVVKLCLVLLLVCIYAVTGFVDVNADELMNDFQARKDITIKFYWDDLHNAAGVRPTSMVVKLYANGDCTARRLVATNDTWTVTFKNLPIYEDGGKVEYTVQQMYLPNAGTAHEYQYISTITTSQYADFIIVNKYRAVAQKEVTVNNTTENTGRDYLANSRQNSNKVTNNKAINSRVSSNRQVAINNDREITVNETVLASHQMANNTKVPEGPIRMAQYDKTPKTADRRMLPIYYAMLIFSGIAFLVGLYYKKNILQR